MKFTMAVRKTVASKLGHTIHFEPGVATHVPKECWRDVQEAGAVPEDQKEVNKTEPPKPAAPDDPVQRREAIFGAFEKMVAANKRDDFTGAGLPKTDAIAKLVGFDVDAKERSDLWVEFTQGGGTQK